MAVPQTWHSDWTLVSAQSLQQLCPHWNSTERTFCSHRGQLTVSGIDLPVSDPDDAAALAGLLGADALLFETLASVLACLP